MYSIMKKRTRDMVKYTQIQYLIKIGPFTGQMKDRQLNESLLVSHVI